MRLPAARQLVVLASVGLVGLAFPAAAAEDLAGGAVAVDFAWDGHGAPWVPRALEQAVRNELARFQRVTLLPPVSPKACAHRGVPCLLDAYAAAGADVVVLGALEPGALAYQVYEVSTRTRASGGTLALAHLSAGAFEHQLSELARPIVRSGGLLDTLPRRSTSAAVAAPARAAAAGGAAPLLDWRLAVLAGLLLLTLWPMALPRLALGGEAVRQHLRHHPRPKSWAWTAALVTLLALGLALAAIGAGSLSEALAPWGVAARVAALLPAARVALPLAGGVLWAALALAALRWVVPVIPGLGRAQHQVLWPLVRAWVTLFLVRAPLLALVAPAPLVALQAAEAAGLDARLSELVLAPAAGLCALFWWLSVADNLAFCLDVTLVAGRASAANSWHRSVRHYFGGYLKRHGLSLGRGVLEQVLFLPGRVQGVVGYGGGFARPRVLVAEGLLELALGELPEEGDLAERTVNAEELPLGELVPAFARSEAEGPGRPGRPHSAEALRRDRGHAPPRPRAPVPRLVGEHATLLGLVAPRAGDETIPLIANSTEDLRVVRSLLTEHYAAFEQGSLDDDVDDTDPTQRDFLFGALLREVGAVQRGDGLFATFALALRSSLARASRPARALLRLAGAVGERLLSWPAAAVADAYAALNGGLHHLVQYLHHARTLEEAPLTARADEPGLMRATRDVLGALSVAPPTGDERHLLRATPRARLTWLSRFLQAPLVPPGRRAPRVLAALALSLGLLAFAAHAAWQAIDYHLVYTERMRVWREAASDTAPGGPDAGSRPE